MPISQKPLRSETGFISPGFSVGVDGTINFIGDLKKNGTAIFSGNSLSSGILNSSLVQLGTLTGLTVNGNTTLAGGTIQIASTGTLQITSTGALSINSTATGSINNTTIGITTPAAGKFTTVDVTTGITIDTKEVAVLNPSTTKQLNNYNIGATTRGTGAFTTLSANTLSADTGLSLSPSSVGSINNTTVGITTPAAGKFTTVTITQEPTASTQATTKKYVDTVSAALAIALGS